MSLKRFSDWFITPAGRNVVLGFATATTMGIFSWNAIPNTFLLDKYREIVQLYQSGLSVPVSKTLKERFDKALELAEVSDSIKSLYKPFNVFGFDIFSAGSSYSKYGCIVGFPVNFTYEDVDTINKQDIKVEGNSVAWDLDEGQQLLHSLVLTEKAQLYAMAREIKMLQSPKMLLDTFYATASVIGAYGLGLFFNQRLNLYGRPVFVRSVLYCLVGAFVGGNYTLAKDFSQVYYEKKIDEELRKKDPSLQEGGAEFYRKILMRNQALRKLMGKDGEYQYTVLGNENYIIRQRHLPLVQRKEFFEGKRDVL